MDNPKPFGRWLRHRRKELDITQEQLSGCVGCASATIRMIENGQRRPSRQVAELLANCLRVPEPDRAGFLAHARATLATTTPEGNPDEALATLGRHTSVPHSEAQTAIANNLPTQPTSLFGRDADIKALLNLLHR